MKTPAQHSESSSSRESSTVLITGAGGFLGSHLAEYFLEAGSSVIGIDNFSSGFRSNLDYLKAHRNAKKLKFFEKDVTEDWSYLRLSDATKDLLPSLKYVFHFASPASPPIYQKLNLETMWVNTLGLMRALEFADSFAAKVVFASTSEIYGDPEVSPQKESYWGHVNSFGERSCYDEAKRFGESLIFSHNKRFKTQHGLVRIFNTYGPRMNPSDGRVIINFLAQALQGQSLSVYGDGQQTRSFCYVDDLIRGITKYADLNLAEPMNLGNPNEFTILQLAQSVQELFKDKGLQLQFCELPKDDPKQRCPDISKALELLPDWKPRTELHEGLIQMSAWLAKVLKA